MAKARQIGRAHAVILCENRNQVTVLMIRRRITVEQEYVGRSVTTGACIMQFDSRW